MSERKYVACRDREDGTREYYCAYGGWTANLRNADRYTSRDVDNGNACIAYREGRYLVPLRPKGAPRRQEGNVLTTTAKWNELVRERAAFKALVGVLEKARNDAETERDAARAEVAVIRSERDQMQGRWETARVEAQRLSGELAQWERLADGRNERLDTAIANARRAAVEECLNLCLAEEKEFRDVIATEPQHKSFALHCTFGVAAVERALRALLTTPTADDGEGEA